MSRYAAAAAAASAAELDEYSTNSLSFGSGNDRTPPPPPVPPPGGLSDNSPPKQIPRNKRPTRKAREKRPVPNRSGRSSSPRQKRERKRTLSSEKSAKDTKLEEKESETARESEEKEDTSPTTPDGVRPATPPLPPRWEMSVVASEAEHAAAATRELLNSLERSWMAGAGEIFSETDAQLEANFEAEVRHAAEVEEARLLEEARRMEEEEEASRVELGRSFGGGGMGLSVGMVKVVGVVDGGKGEEEEEEGGDVGEWEAVVGVDLGSLERVLNDPSRYASALKSGSLLLGEALGPWAEALRLHVASLGVDVREVGAAIAEGAGESQTSARAAETSLPASAMERARDGAFGAAARAAARRAALLDSPNLFLRQFPKVRLVGAFAHRGAGLPSSFRDHSWTSAENEAAAVPGIGPRLARAWRLAGEALWIAVRRNRRQWRRAREQASHTAGAVQAQKAAEEANARLDSLIARNADLKPKLDALRLSTLDRLQSNEIYISDPTQNSSSTSSKLSAHANQILRQDLSHAALRLASLAVERAGIAAVRETRENARTAARRARSRYEAQAAAFVAHSRQAMGNALASKRQKTERLRQKRILLEQRLQTLNTKGAELATLKQKVREKWTALGIRTQATSPSTSTSTSSSRPSMVRDMAKHFLLKSLKRSLNNPQTEPSPQFLHAIDLLCRRANRPTPKLETPNESQTDPPSPTLPDFPWRSRTPLQHSPLPGPPSPAHTLLRGSDAAEPLEQLFATLASLPDPLEEESVDDTTSNNPSPSQNISSGDGPTQKISYGGQDSPETTPPKQTDNEEEEEEDEDETLRMLQEKLFANRGRLLHPSSSNEEDDDDDDSIAERLAQQKEMEEDETRRADEIAAELAKARHRHEQARALLASGWDVDDDLDKEILSHKSPAEKELIGITSSPGQDPARPNDDARTGEVGAGRAPAVEARASSSAARSSSSLRAGQTRRDRLPPSLRQIGSSEEESLEAPDVDESDYVQALGDDEDDNEDEHLAPVPTNSDQFPKSTTSVRIGQGLLLPGEQPLAQDIPGADQSERAPQIALRTGAVMSPRRLARGVDPTYSKRTSNFSSSSNTTSISSPPKDDEERELQATLARALAATRS